MSNETRTFDVIIIGGGAAGMMAAISTKKHHPELSVALLDRTFALGRKVLVCGAGRCNITNINLDTSAQSRYYGAESSFTSAVFDQFQYKDIVAFFNDLGIELYVERKTAIGKLFPVTDQAKTVTALLEDELERLGITIILNTDCTSIQKNGNQFLISAQTLEQNQPTGSIQKYTSTYLIMAAGGKTYPALGSNGSGYTLAQSLGHSIIGPVPSALPLVGQNPLSQELQGTKMEMEVTSYINGKEIKKTIDDVMFTQYGFSGPAILNISREISIHINRNHQKEAQISLNFFPGKTNEQVREILTARWNKRPNQTIEKSLYGIFPNKIPPMLLKLLEINPQKKAKDLLPQEITTLCNKLTHYKASISGTRGWNEAEFTAGGIDTKEVQEGTLQSKKIANLYFCGELLDVDGDVGGFNLSWAWCSGFVAGKLS